MNDRRKSMEPYHLELLIFLRTNRNLWDYGTIQELVEDPIEIVEENDVNIETLFEIDDEKNDYESSDDAADNCDDENDV